MSLIRYRWCLVAAATVAALLAALFLRLGPAAGVAAVLVVTAAASYAAFSLFGFLGPLWDGLHAATGRLGQGDLSRMPEPLAAPGEFGHLAENVRKVCKGMVKHLGEIVRNTALLERNAEQIKSGIDQVVRAGHTQTAGVEEINALVQAYEDKNREIVELSRQAETLAAATGDLAVQGVARIDGIRRMVDDMQARVTAMEKAADDILDTAAVIADIARQTNFLALSAAIEAARAGEHGRGFETVAGQVVRLAEGAGQATAEISQIVAGVRRELGDTKRAVGEGLEKLRRFAASFAEVQAKADGALAAARGVGSTLIEQGETAGKVTAHVRSIARVAAETAAAAEAAGSTTDGIAQVVERFKAVADTYRI